MGTGTAKRRMAYIYLDGSYLGTFCDMQLGVLDNRLGLKSPSARFKVLAVALIYFSNQQISERSEVEPGHLP